MILYCAANKPYFDIYFDLWARQLQKFYPSHKKVIALYGGTTNDIQHANDLGVEVRDVTTDKRFPNELVKGHLFLLRWAHLPWDMGQQILETQINCLAVNSAMTIPKDNMGVEHIRLSRWKPKPQGKVLGGLSCAVFTPTGAKKIVDQATVMIENPAKGDHEINHWQGQNLSHKLVYAEQQFKGTTGNLQSDTRWITAGTSAHYTHEQKLQILKHYIK